MIIVHREAELFEIVGALRATGCLASGLNGRQEQGDQDGNDCNHHQQLDQREASSGSFSF
jgi:hypothetical protein